MTSPAQSTMRQAYINGGPGVCVSGLVWLLAAAVTHFNGFTPGIITFFVGGMLIHPLSVLISKAIKKTPVTPDKGLMRLSVMTLPILFGGLYLAYLVSAENQSLFYQVMAVAIGLRYLVFQRIYGLKAFKVLGLTLCLFGVLSYLLQSSLGVVPFCVGVAELFFGCRLTFRETQSQSNKG